MTVSDRISIFDVFARLMCAWVPLFTVLSVTPVSAETQVSQKSMPQSNLPELSSKSVVTGPKARSDIRKRYGILDPINDSKEEIEAVHILYGELEALYKKRSSELKTSANTQFILKEMNSINEDMTYVGSWREKLRQQMKKKLSVPYVDYSAKHFITNKNDYYWTNPRTVAREPMKGDSLKINREGILHTYGRAYVWPFIPGKEPEWI